VTTKSSVSELANNPQENPAYGVDVDFITIYHKIFNESCRVVFKMPEGLRIVDLQSHMSSCMYMYVRMKELTHAACLLLVYYWHRVLVGAAAAVSR